MLPPARKTQQSECATQSDRSSVPNLPHWCSERSHIVGVRFNKRLDSDQAPILDPAVKERWPFSGLISGWHVTRSWVHAALSALGLGSLVNRQPVEDIRQWPRVPRADEAQSSSREPAPNARPPRLARCPRETSALVARCWHRPRPPAWKTVPPNQRLRFFWNPWFLSSTGTWSYQAHNTNRLICALKKARSEGCGPEPTPRRSRSPRQLEQVQSRSNSTSRFQLMPLQ